MNRRKWCDFTWNPVTGCLHGCKYCYARKMSARWNRIRCEKCKGCGLDEPFDDPYANPDCCPACNGSGTVPDPDAFKPKFHPNRLDQPAKRKKPARIFVVSMGDLFGEWVDDSWIEQVFAACEAAKQHIYYFLTKNPARYFGVQNGEYKSSMVPNKKNWFFGHSTNGKLLRSHSIDNSNWFNRYISMEPLLYEPAFISELKDVLSWLIVGSETKNGKPVNMPKREWILDIRTQCKELGIPLFEKDSLAGLQLPGGLIQEWPDNK